MAAIFEDRSDAGGRLARALEHFRDCGTIVLAIPRGGVPVARRRGPWVRLSTSSARAIRDVRQRPPRLRRPARPKPHRDLNGERDLTGARVIIVDDGVATGATARAACRTVRRLGAVEVVLAVPVAPPDWTRTLAGEADAFVAVATPHPSGRWASGTPDSTVSRMPKWRHAWRPMAQNLSDPVPLWPTCAYSANQQADTVNSTPRRLRWQRTRTSSCGEIT